MKLYSHFIVGLILFSFTLQGGMKYAPEFKLELAVEPGIKIFDTGHGWLFTTKGTGRFPAKVVYLLDSGDIMWDRTFAFPASYLLPHEGGAYMLDVHGNFFEIGRSGSVEHNLVAVVPHGKNIMAKSSSDLVFASGGDDTITCFHPDGNIEWMIPLSGSATNIFVRDNQIFVSDRLGNLSINDFDGEIGWTLQLSGFSSSSPVPTQENNLVYGTRNVTGGAGNVYEISSSGEIVWELKLGHGVDWLFAAGDGYLAMGSMFVTSLDKDGNRLWGQSFEQSKKLFPMGFISDGRLVLGILNSERDTDSLKITLLDWGGRIAEVTKIPVKKNQLVDVSRRGYLVLIGDKEETLVYRLLTMKEYLEKLND